MIKLEFLGPCVNPVHLRFHHCKLSLLVMYVKCVYLCAETQLMCWFNRSGAQVSAFCGPNYVFLSMLRAAILFFYNFDEF